MARLPEESDYSPTMGQHSMNFYRGGHPSAKVLATIGACGLGGFNCTSGGEEPHCYVRFCRMDLHEGIAIPGVSLAA